MAKKSPKNLQVYTLSSRAEDCTMSKAFSIKKYQKLRITLSIIVTNIPIKPQQFPASSF